MSRLRTFLIASVALLAAPASAHAAVLTAAAGDPVGDSAGGAPVDIQHVSTSYDSDAGTWTLTLRLAGPASDTEWAMISTALSDAPCGVAGTGSAAIRASTKPSGTAVVGSVSSGQTTVGYESAERHVSADGREITLKVAAGALRGRSAGCLSLTLSHNRVLDVLQPTLTLAAGNSGAQQQPAQPPAGATTHPSGDPAQPGGGAAQPGGADQVQPPVIAFGASSKTLHARRDGTIRLYLFPFAQGVRGIARVRAGGVTIATARWSAPAHRRVALRLRISAAGRRFLRRHRRSTASLTVTAIDAGRRQAARSRITRLLAR
jgi:hypothetical protein